MIADAEYDHVRDMLLGEHEIARANGNVRHAAQKNRRRWPPPVRDSASGPLCVSDAWLGAIPSVAGVRLRTEHVHQARHVEYLGHAVVLIAL